MEIIIMILTIIGLPIYYVSTKIPKGFSFAGGLMAGFISGVFGAILFFIVGDANTPISQKGAGTGGIILLFYGFMGFVICFMLAIIVKMIIYARIKNQEILIEQKKTGIASVHLEQSKEDKFLFILGLAFRGFLIGYVIDVIFETTNMIFGEVEFSVLGIIGILINVSIGNAIKKFRARRFTSKTSQINK